IPLLVQFSDFSTNSPTAWSWNFGDGSTSTLQNPAHTYAKVGNFTVSLIATNAGGSSPKVSMTNYITTILPAVPVANFTGAPTSGAAPLVVQFTDQSINGPTAWSWSF